MYSDVQRRKQSKLKNPPWIQMCNTVIYIAWYTHNQQCFALLESRLHTNHGSRIGVNYCNALHFIMIKPLQVLITYLLCHLSYSINVQNYNLEIKNW